MENYLDVIGAVVLMSGVVVIIFIIARYTYLVKKSMIENGVPSSNKAKKTRLLDFGCISGGLGFGLMVSSIFSAIDLDENTTDLLVWGTILIFGAMGLILAYFLRSKLGD